MNIYLCLYKTERITVHAETTAEAQRKAQAVWKLTERQRPQITVYLQDIGGTPYRHSAPAPKKPKKPKPDRWMTPAQVAEDCLGWTPGAVLVIAETYIMQPDAAGRAKLSKRAPDGRQNHERFPRLIATAQRWLGMITGSALTAGDTTTDGHGLTSTAFLDQYGRKVCDVNARIIRTVEHYCGAGYWCFGPPKEMFIAYRHPNGPTMAIVSPLTD
jgi:hypothetical protein